MAGSRTLKLSILGDVDNLNKSLKSATADVETFGDKMGKVGKAIGAAFAAAAAAAAAYAVKIGIDGVKAAIADEKAQTQLALALENATGATKAQIQSTEDSILQMSLASGVADDMLRPALGRLVRSTGDITKAQDLLSTALDISAATGKPLESVANALSRAYDGNTTSLGKLGIGLSSAELKTMSFEQVQGKLSDLFGGAAAANADTYSGKIARMQIAFDEAKETIGFALLPILEKVMNFINTNALPAIQAFSSAFSLEKGGLGGVITDVGNIMVSVFTPIINGLIKAFGYIKDAVVSNLDSFQEFGFYIETYLAPIIGTVLGGALQVVGKIASGLITIISNVVSAINGLIGIAIAGINAVISAYNAIPILPNIGTLATPATPSLSSGSSTGTAKKPIVTSKGVANATASASKVTTAIKNLSPAAAAGVSASARQDAAMAARGGSGINITVNGAIDKEGTARTIVDTLNNSFYRGGGGGANSLVTA
jgi:hypothetical protein